MQASRFERLSFDPLPLLNNGFTLTGIARLGVASVEESYFYPFGYAGFSVTPTDDDGTLALIGFEHDTLVRTAQTDLRYTARWMWARSHMISCSG